MIFVTVGTHYQGFTRLIQKMDEIAKEIDEKIIMQIGSTKYIPRNAEYFKYKGDFEIQELNKNARVIVCHDGAGSIINAMQYFKPIIAVPRQKKYGEIAYDSKAELANELEKEGKIIVVNDIKDLNKILENIKITNLHIKQDLRLINTLKDYITFSGEKI